MSAFGNTMTAAKATKTNIVIPGKPGAGLIRLERIDRTARTMVVVAAGHGRIGRSVTDRGVSDFRPSLICDAYALFAWEARNDGT